MCVALPLIVCLILREYGWRIRLSKWDRSKDSILRYEEDPGSDIACPVVEFTHMVEVREQICEFNLRHHGLGEDVAIVANPKTGKIYILSFRDRWTLSIILIGSSLFCAILAFASN